MGGVAKTLLESGFIELGPVLEGEFGGGEDFGEEEPVAEGAADEVGVFSDEANAGALSKVSFKNGTSVNIPKFI